MLGCCGSHLISFSCAGSKSVDGNKIRKQRVTLPQAKNASPPPRLQKVKRVPAAIESSLRLIEDSRGDDDWAASYTSTRSAAPHGRPSTPRLVAADKPRLQAAPCTSAAESTHSPASARTRRPDGMLSPNVLDGPFYLDSALQAPEAVEFSNKVKSVAPRQPAIPTHSNHSTARSSSSHSHDLNSSFRQFMVDKLHAAHKSGQLVDSAKVLHKKHEQRAEQRAAKAAAHQLLAGVYPAEVRSSQCTATHGTKSDIGVGQPTDVGPSEAAVDSSGGVLGRGLHSSLELQPSQKTAEAGDDALLPGELPAEGVIGVALVTAAAASAAGGGSHFDTPAATGCGDESEMLPKTGCKAQQSREGVLHTFVADRLLVEGTDMPETSLNELAGGTDKCPDNLQVQQQQERGVADATIGAVGTQSFFVLSIAASLQQMLCALMHGHCCLQEVILPPAAMEAARVIQHHRYQVQQEDRSTASLQELSQYVVLLPGATQMWVAQLRILEKVHRLVVTRTKMPQQH